MRCPACRAEVDDGAEVCPRCLAALPGPEDSLDLWGEGIEVSRPEVLTSARRTVEVSPAEALGAIGRARAARQAAEHGSPEVPRAEAAPTPRRRPADRHPPTGPQPRGSGPAAAPAPAAVPAGAPPQPAAAGRRFGPQAEIATHLMSGDPEADRGTQIVEIALPPVVRAARRAADDEGAGAALAVEESAVSRGVDAGIASLRLTYARMQRLDRGILWALLLAVVGCFLPWASVRGEGLLAGIQDPIGLPSLGLALLALGALILRTVRRRLATALLMVQLLLTAALAGAPVYRLLTAGEVQFSVGPFVTVAAAGAALVVMLLRLARPG